MVADGILLLYKTVMSASEHPQSYDFEFFKRVSQKNTEEKFYEALADSTSHIVLKDIVVEYLVDLAREMDSAQEDHEDLLKKKTRILYQALELLDEVVDFLSSDLSDLLSPDYPEKAEELREKVRSAADKLEEQNSKLDDPADVEDINRLL